MSDDISMGALSGSIAERSRAAIAAGCDVVLHCNGRLEEMKQVAAAVPAVAGEVEERAHGELARRKIPNADDLSELGGVGWTLEDEVSRSAISRT
jgi:beta-N-acetylhexosaminidase